MERKFLEDFGIEKEVIDKILDQHSSEIGKQKNAIGALTTERDGLKTQLGEANTKLEGYDPEWKAKAEAAQGNAQKEIDALRFDYALTDALKAAKARDTISVKAHLKTEALKLDGENILGLKEQLETLKSEKDFLFESDEKPPIFSASTPGMRTDPEKGKEAANNALRELFARKED